MVLITVVTSWTLMGSVLIRGTWLAFGRVARRRRCWASTRLARGWMRTGWLSASDIPDTL
jgi:hypothetical protein